MKLYFTLLFSYSLFNDAFVAQDL